jgi:hypothetical protein
LRKFALSSLDRIPADGSRTAKARAVRLTQTAHLAVDDPLKLAQAARIVRAALARRKLTQADLTPLPALDDVDGGGPRAT